MQDCNVMIAIYNPHRDGLKTYHKYNIELLKNNFRSIMVLKNRFGDCDVEVGVNFFGGINYFHEIPKPDEIFDYEKYTNPNYLLNLDDTNEVDDFNVEDTSNNYNFVL